MKNLGRHADTKFYTEMLELVTEEHKFNQSSRRRIDIFQSVCI